MNRQADSLRFLALQMKNNLQAKISGQEKTTRVITVTSGKGGVGKTNFSVNLALALREMNYNVLILDADLGLANIDVILGISTHHNLLHVINGEKSIHEIIYEGPRGLQIIPGGSGIQELANLKDYQVENFLASLSRLDGYADLLIIDTGAGISNSVLSFALAAEEVIVVTTTEPTAITDAYGLIKTLRQQMFGGKIEVVVNRASSVTDGNIVYEKLRVAASRFLNYHVEFLGVIREDPKVSRAVKEQQPFILGYPTTMASQDIYQLAASLTQSKYVIGPKKGIKSFFNRLSEYFR